MNILNPVDSVRTKFQKDSFFTISNDYGSGFIFKKHSMQYFPKCGRKLPENGINVAVVIPFPQKPSPRMRKRFNLALVQ